LILYDCLSEGNLPATGFAHLQLASPVRYSTFFSDLSAITSSFHLFCLVTGAKEQQQQQNGVNFTNNLCEALLNDKLYTTSLHTYRVKRTPGKLA